MADELKSKVPTAQITIVDSRQELPTIATAMNVDRIHSIFDAAETGYTSDLFALYRDIVVADSHIQTEFTKRKLAVLGDAMEVSPVDAKQSADVLVADAVRSQVAHVRGWLNALSHLLDSTMWPVAVCEKVYRSSGKNFELSAVVPVPHHLLTFKNGYLQILIVDPLSHGITGECIDPDPDRYIIHRGNLLSMPDNWGGPMRSIVWWWFLSSMTREWWSQFLDKYGGPFIVGSYDQADDKSRQVLERAFRFSKKLGGLVVSKETEIEIKQAAASDTGAAYATFLAICQREKSKLVLGQTLSAQTDPTGLGSGTSNAHEAVRDDIRQFDASMLSHTLQDQLFAQIARINNMVGSIPACRFGGASSSEIAATSKLLTDLKTADLEVADDSLATISSRLGIQIQRKAAAFVPGFFSAYSASPGRRSVDAARDAIDTLSANASNDIARAFRGRYAPLARMVRESTSASDLERRVRAYMAEVSPGETADVLSLALNAFAVNGVLA
jgi:phage gp29-like protein